MNPSDLPQALGALVDAEPLVQRLVPVSLELAVLSLATAVLIRIARVRSPRLVCLLWLVVLAKPLVSLTVGSPVALAHLDVSAPRVVAPVSGDVASGAGGVDGVEAGREGASARTPSTVSGGPASVSPAAPEQVRDSMLRNWLASISLKQAVVGLWLAGVLAFLIAHLHARLRLQRFIRAARAASPAVAERYRILGAQLGLRRVPRLLVTDSLESPAIVGLVRPTILLPSWLAADAGGRKLDWAMRHELMHWRWLDPLSVFIRDVAVILFWFHPGIWWAGKRMTEAMELACDRAMVRTPSDATDYAEQLFGILQNLCDRRRPAVAGGLFATRTQVGNRIAALLDGSCADAPQMTSLSALGVMALAGVALAVGVAAPMAVVQQASDEPAKPVRVLHFSEDRSLGALYVLDAGIQRQFEPDGYTYTVDQPDMRWQHLAEARGDVAIPAGKRVRLVLSDKSGGDLSSLSKLQPDDLYELQLGKTVDDKCLPHLARLTGLKVLEFPYPYPDSEKLPVITVQGLKGLAGLKSLERLRTPSRMTDAGLAAIVETLPQLKVLSFGPNQITDRGLAALPKLRALEEITIGGGEFTNAGLAHLAELPSLHYVWLWGGAENLGERITDAVLVQFRRIAALRTLKLPPIVTDAGLAHLAGHPKIENLWLYDSKVTDQGMAHLKSMPSLKNLNIGKRDFDRRNPPITDAATVHLKEIKSLEDLRLPADGVTDAGLVNLSELGNLKHLELPMPSWIDPKDYLKPYTAEGLKAMAKVRSLESLSIAGPGVTDAALSHVVQLTNLRSLSLFGCPITNEGFAKLGALKSLETLEVGGGGGPGAPQLTVSGLNSLGGLSRLTRLQVNQLRNGDAAMNIAGLARLEYLMLSCAKGSVIRDEDLACLARLKQLKWVQVSSIVTPQAITDAGLAHLAGLTAMERLTIGGGGVTDRGLACFANMRKLDSLSVTGHFTDDGLRSLEGLSTLRYLWVYSGSNLSPAAKERVRKSLPNLVLFTADNHQVVGRASVAMTAAPGTARSAIRSAAGVRAATAAPGAARPAAASAPPRPAMMGTATRPAIGGTGP